jgi:predicted KAP-like P-loop ATPase
VGTISLDKERWSRIISDYKRVTGEDGQESSILSDEAYGGILPPPRGLPSKIYGSLSADKPLNDPRDDQLGYAPFARHLAYSLTKMVPADGFIVAIYGPWGSGKTTLLNFLFHYFQQAPPDEQPILVPFNPWWFSGHENMAKHFFDQFQSSLAASDLNQPELQNKIFEFAEMVSELPASIHIPYISIGKIAVEFTPMKPALKNIVKLKMEIAEALWNQSRRIFITVDDIDRLNPEEVRQLFGIIKSVADFPNIVYLLTFDKKVVMDALRGSHGISGENYLEKIVQSPFELPLPDRLSLDRLLFDRLEAIMAGTPEGLLDQTYWGKVFLKGVEHFLSTPRKVNLLTNTLIVTYPAVRGEVNSVDFIGIETLRIFCPEAYNMVRTYPDKFNGLEWVSHRIEQLRTFHLSWFSNIPEEDREAVKGLLSELFPKLQSVWEDMSFTPSMEATWRKQLRICSPDIFPIFFHLALPHGNIAHAEIKAIISQAGDPQAFSSRLLDLAGQPRLDGHTRLYGFLDRLLDYTEKEIPLESIPSILLSLMDVGDQLMCPEDQGSGKLHIGNDQRVIQIIWELLRRLPDEIRFDCLRQAIDAGQAIFTSTRIVLELDKLQNKYASDGRPKGQKLIQTNDHDTLVRLVLAKVRGAARDGSLLDGPKLPEILFQWKIMAGEEEPKSWVTTMALHDSGLAGLLEKFLEKDFGHTMIKMEGVSQFRINFKALESFLDLREIMPRIPALLESSDLSAPQKDALAHFLKIYENSGP